MPHGEMSSPDFVNVATSSSQYQLPHSTCHMERCHHQILAMRLLHLRNIDCHHNTNHIVAVVDNFRETSYWCLLEYLPKGLEIAIVQAENGVRWQEDVLQKPTSLCRKGETSEEGKISLHILPKSGHWVHVDNRKGSLEIMAPNFVSRGWNSNAMDHHLLWLFSFSYIWNSESDCWGMLSKFSCFSYFKDSEPWHLAIYIFWYILAYEMCLVFLSHYIWKQLWSKCYAFMVVAARDSYCGRGDSSRFIV